LLLLIIVLPCCLCLVPLVSSFLPQVQETRQKNIEEKKKKFLRLINEIAEYHWIGKYFFSLVANSAQLDIALSAIASSPQRKKFIAELVKIRVIGFGWDKATWKLPVGGQAKNSAEVLRDHLAVLLDEKQPHNFTIPLRPPFPSSDVHDMDKVMLRSIAAPTFQAFTARCKSEFDQLKSDVEAAINQRGDACLKQIIADHFMSSILPKIAELPSTEEANSSEHGNGEEDGGGGAGGQIEGDNSCNIHLGAPISLECPRLKCPFCCNLDSCTVQEHRDAFKMMQNFINSHFSAPAAADNSSDYHFDDETFDDAAVDEEDRLEMLFDTGL